MRSSLVFAALMLGIVVLGAAVAGANVGIIEVSLWLAVFVVGLVLIAFGSRRSAPGSNR